MFADIVGYTQMMQADEVYAKAQRDRKRSVITQYLSKYHGHVMQYYGDGALIMFGSALQAVKCARDMQTELNKDPKVPIRIGIHTGDVVYDDEGIYGDAVNVASRIQSLGMPGSVMISENVYNEIKNHNGIRVESAGVHTLKNIAEPLKIFTLSHDSDNGKIENQHTESVKLSGDRYANAKADNLKRRDSDIFRISYRNHIELGAIADLKATVMISINAIIISIMIASITVQISSSSVLLLPGAIILITCMISLIYSVMAARPRLGIGKANSDEVRSKGSNILFFDNFDDMHPEDYVTGMKELLSDSESLNNMIGKDLHSLGVILSKKFRLLRTSYSIFMAGLIISVCSLLLIYLLT